MLSSGDDEQKPLFRKWYSQAKKTGRKDLALIIESIRLSSSEEWIIVETEENIALINAESKLGSQFWENLQKFKGEGIALKIFPSKGKLGFNIDFCEDVKRFYIWEEDKVELCEKKNVKSALTNGIGQLTWENSQKKLKELSEKTSKNSTEEKNGSATGKSGASSKTTIQE